MEAACQPDDSPRCSLFDGSADLDLLDQLLASDDWLEFPDCSSILQNGTLNPMSPLNSLTFSPLVEVNDGRSNPNLSEMGNQGDKESSDATMNTFPSETQIKKNDAKQSRNSGVIGQVVYSLQSDELNAKSSSSEPTANWWAPIQPRDPNFFVKERFKQALAYINESHKDSDVLVQIWVPVKRGDQLVLTTCSQPFSLNYGCEKLVNYREISENYQFSAETNSGQALGLPGRVFVGRLPEWTPDVRYFSSVEYPRVSHAQRFDVRGTIALPVFERFGRNCLGVIEVVMTTQRITYSVELENICNALQAVDLRSSGALTIPRIKASTDSYQATLYEILEVLKAVCKLHMLPLAQTWVPCIQLGKQGNRHSDENYEDCISTADEACYVNCPPIRAFHEACSEHHLLRGQGVAGKAFTTNQPCYLPDITSSSKTQYPLSHHARMFDLKGAVAIRLRSTRTGTADFVLEFFLPTNCTGVEEQKLVLESLSSSIQNFSHTLRVVTIKELENEAISQVNELIPSDNLFQEFDSRRGLGLNYGNSILGGKCEGVPSEVTAAVTSILETPEKELSSNVEFDATEELVVTTERANVVLPAGKTLSNNIKKPSQDFVVNAAEHMDSDRDGFQGATKETEKRRMKKEKTISLQVLRKYFSGSLKDAAKSIGVSPTTLKRICRQHGITRWPSRKIKKVDHSLRKLQMVIDSVHGANKAIQLSSLYKDFSMASGSDDKSSTVVIPPSPNQHNHLKSMEKQQEDRFNLHLSSSSQSASKCSQRSSSGFSSSSEEKRCSQAAEFSTKQEAIQERLSYIHQGTSGQEFIMPPKEAQKHVVDSQIHDSIRNTSPLDNKSSSWIKVKAKYGSETVRLRLNPTWSFHDMKEEILKRFNLGLMSSMNLKYLDDDSEWVLLTCDADLHECLHVCRLTGAQTIRIRVEPFVNVQTRGSLGLIGSS